MSEELDEASEEEQEIICVCCQGKGYVSILVDYYLVSLPRVHMPRFPLYNSVGAYQSSYMGYFAHLRPIRPPIDYKDITCPICEGTGVIAQDDIDGWQDRFKAAVSRLGYYQNSENIWVKRPKLG